HDDAHGNWFTAWSISIGHRMGPAFTGANFAPDVSSSTLRMIVRPSIAGGFVRVRLENTQAQTPVTFSAAYVGIAGTGAAVVPGTNRQLTFGGSAGLTLAAGGSAWSDPVKLAVEAFQRVTVSLDVASAVEVSGHQLGLVTNYVGVYGTAAGPSGDGFTPVPANGGNYPFYYVAALDVKSATASGTIVALGDSITDGRCSTRDPATGEIPADQYNRWTDVLAMRLQARYGRFAPAVANEAIAGNRVVAGGNGPPALVRLQNDVLDRAGLGAVIFYEGTNDISGGASAGTLIAGLQEVIDRVHAAGVPIYGGTVIARGRPAPLAGWDGAREAVKVQVNHWMHTEANFDGLVEFGALLAGPLVIGSDGAPVETMWDEWNCFDYTHPNKFGLEAMGNLVDLELFKPVQRR
ncbi:MAG TPA: GDSL-type esterase/lipase family protein, partial [Anaeromyxobacteraceae bacterium]|nr:GDSL-type esterase/lipase family protein [Anaeromyxobacteraceae bacterium]